MFYHYVITCLQIADELRLFQPKTAHASVARHQQMEQPLQTRMTVMQTVLLLTIFLIAINNISYSN